LDKIKTKDEEPDFTGLEEVKSVFEKTKRAKKIKVVVR